MFSPKGIIVMASDFLYGLVISAIAFAWTFGTYKSIGYAVSRRRNVDKTLKESSKTSASLTQRAMLLYACIICAYAGILLGVVFNNRQMFAPLFVWGSLGTAILFFYCALSTGKSGNEDALDLKIRQQLPKSKNLPKGQVLSVSHPNWIANKPSLFIIGVLATICSISFCLIFERYFDLTLSLPGIMLLTTLYIFSRLNYISVKKSHISIGDGFPIQEIIDFSYEATLSISVTQNWMQQLLHVYAITIAEKGGNEITIPLSDGQEVQQLIQDTYRLKTQT